MNGQRKKGERKKQKLRRRRPLKTFSVSQSFLKFFGQMEKVFLVVAAVVGCFTESKCQLDAIHNSNFAQKLVLIHCQKAIDYDELNKTTQSFFTF